MAQLATSESKPSNGKDSMPKYTPRSVMRVTVVEQVYYESPDGSHNIGESYSQNLSKDEQPFVRTRAIGSSWMDVSENCWVDRGSVIVLANREGKIVLVNPSEDDKKIISSRLIEVGVVGESSNDPISFTQLLPGASCRLPGPFLKRIRVRCLGDKAKLSIAVLSE